MIEMTLAQAWGYWLCGQQLAHATLWGFPILWLGRAGKIAQFVGAAMVLAEIIGPARIQAFGESLLALASFEKVRSSLRAVIAWLRNLYYNRHPSPDDLRERKVTWQEIKREPLLFVATAVSLSSVVVAWVYSPLSAWWANLMLSILLLYLLQLFVAPFVAAAISVATLGVIGLVGLLVVKPIASLLALKALDIWIKVFAFLCLVLGFHFDLLSS